MGQAMRKLTSVTLREVKSYNIESKAEKVISRDKPTAAPMYPSTVKELERLKEENVSTEYLHKKDEQLDNFLKKVYISTPDPAPPLERKINPDRPLPLNKSTDRGISFGYSASEEAVVPEGKVTLKQTLTFISHHQSDPKKYSKAAIASQYKMSLEDIDNILEHFKMLSVRVEKKPVDPESLTAFERLQLKVNNMTTYNSAAVVKEMHELFKQKGEESNDENKPDEKDAMLKKLEGEATESRVTTSLKQKRPKKIQTEEVSKRKKDQLKLDEDRKTSQENG